MEDGVDTSHGGGKGEFVGDGGDDLGDGERAEVAGLKLGARVLGEGDVVG